MKKFSRLLFLVILSCLLDYGPPLRAECRETAILENANAVLCELATMHLNRIPLAWLRHAQGVAIFPGLIKAGVWVGGRHGHGVLLIRGADGSWGPPMFLTLSAASFGIQLGVEATDLVLIFLTRSSLDRMKKGKVTLGVDVMIAAGPIGREKEIGADVSLHTAVITHSRSRGLFAGICAEGAVLRLDAAANAAYGPYEQDCLRNGGPTGPGTPPALRLQMKLAELSVVPPESHPVAPLSNASSASSPP